MSAPPRPSPRAGLTAARRAQHHPGRAASPGRARAARGSAEVLLFGAHTLPAPVLSTLSQGHTGPMSSRAARASPSPGPHQKPAPATPCSCRSEPGATSTLTPLLPAGTGQSGSTPTPHPWPWGQDVTCQGPARQVLGLASPPFFRGCSVHSTRHFELTAAMPGSPAQQTPAWPCTSPLLVPGEVTPHGLVPSLWGA